MPIYNYKCKECEEKIEVIQSIKEAKLTECPSCKKEALERLITCTNFQISGIGVYKNGTH